MAMAAVDAFALAVVAALGRALGRVLFALWPVLLGVLAVLVPIARGFWNAWFLLVELGLLLLFVAVTRWTDVRGQPEDVKTKTVTWLLASTVGTGTIAIGVAANPFAVDDAASRVHGAVILVFVALVVAAPFVRAALWPGHRWRFVALHCALAAVTFAIAFPYLTSHEAVEYETWHFLVWGFFLLLGCALALRFDVYAAGSRVRAVAVVFAAVAGARFFWDAFVGDALGDYPHPVDVVLLVALAALVLFDGWRDASPLLPGPGLERWRATGVLFAMLATSLLSVASVLATFGRTAVDHGTLDVQLASAAPALDYEELASRPRAFAAAFSPVLLFPDSDRWLPIRVRSYLAAATTRWADGSPFRPALMSVHSRRCPSTIGSPCRTITIRCPAARKPADDCHRITGFHRGTGAPSRSRAPVYARVVDLERQRDTSRGELQIARFGPYRDRIRWLIQYWYFYFYDEWTTQSLFGRINQSHEADWEFVTVGFGPEGPLFVAYSAHCGGVWRPWVGTSVVPSADAAQAGAHPVAVVGAGSQAMYPGTRADVNPDWGSCLQAGGAKLSLLTIGLNVEENVGATHTVVSDAEDIALVDEHRFPMSVPARWGERNGEIAFFSEFGKRIGGRPEKGPPTPTHQPGWASPLHRIFCTDSWRPTDHREVTDEECRT